MMLLFILISFIYPFDGFEIIYKGHAPSDHFYTDHLENIYFIDKHKIFKVETSSGIISEYGSLSDGTISSADVSNPFNILLFYRDFNQVVFLDNKLAKLRSEINMSGLGIEQAILSCSSGSGGLWVFSDRDNRLVYFNHQLRNNHQSKTISSITGSSTKPVYMIENQNKLFLYIAGEGILVFDRFASYLKTVPYSGPERFQVLGDRIVYFYEGELLSLDIETFEMTSLDLPSGLKIDDVYLQSEGLFLLTGNRIKLFRLR